MMGGRQCSALPPFNTHQTSTLAVDRLFHSCYGERTAFITLKS